MSDSFTPAPLVSDQTVGGFVENDLTPPQTSAWDTFEAAPYLGRVARAAGAASATFGDIDEYGQQITPSEPPISKAEFDSKYSIPGKLDWDGPKPDSVYSSIYQTKLSELQRQDAAERRPAGLVSGAADLGVGFVADALDPLFLGSLIIPGAPEIDLGTSLAARTGARVLEGAAGGALQTAPLVGVNYALAKREQADYSAGSALADLAMGAGMGAALHVGMGAVGDYLDRRMAGSRYRQIIEQDPDARRAAFRTAMGQGLNDDPVEVDPVFNAATTAPGGTAPYPNEPTIPLHAPGPVPDYVTEPTHPDALTPGAQPLEPEPPEPQRLTSWLIAQGGVRDPGGDVRSSMGGFRGRPGLIANAGRTLDDAALNAWQAGFFPDHAERPTINDLLDAVDEDLKGVPHYSNANEAALANYQEARARNSEVLRLSGELGIPTTNITREQFFDAVAEHLSEDDFDARVGQESQRADDLYQEAERQAAVWVAHHGTPHTFDRFDIAHIGTGEGAQAFGHGLYFAENQGVADSYRRTLSGNPDVHFILDGVEHHGDELDDVDKKEPGAFRAIDRMIGTDFKPDMARGQLENDVRRAGSWVHDWDDETIREDLAHYAFPESDEPLAKIKAMVTPEMIAERRTTIERQAAEEKAFAEQALEWFDKNKDRVTRPDHPPGNLYTVNFKAEPHETLDWDKPLSEQPAEVKAAFRHAGFTEEEIERGGFTGADAYWKLADRNGRPTQTGEAAAAASAVLHEGGLKGIRYLDRMSRREGEGDHNVVVFNHDDVEITHRNGEAVEPHKPTEVEAHELQGQEPHGGFDAEQFYGHDQGRSLEDLESEYRREAAGVSRVAGYTTSRGSTYQVHEDGTTTRDKSYHPEHGADDVGVKPRSARTIYVDAPYGAELSAAGLQGLGPQGARLILKDGKASLLTWNRAADRWGVSPGQRDIPFTEHPEVGKQPVEAFSPRSDIPGHEAYAGQHAGNPITEVRYGNRSEAAAADARERGAGGEPGGSPAGDQGGVSGGTEPGGSGVGAAGRESAEDRAAAFSAALRRADGQRPVDPNGAAADAAAKQGPTERLKQAQAQLETDMAYFERENQMGKLTDDVRAELESLGEVDKQANAEGEGAVQAAVCVIRGAGGGAT